MKAIALYGVLQRAEGIPAIRGSVKTGTISVTLADTTVTGITTAFDTELVVGNTIYDSTGAEIGVVEVITSAVLMTISPALIEVTAGEAYSINKITTVSTITTTLIANTITGSGTAFLTDLAEGAYLYDVTGDEVGQIETVTDDVTATLTANALVALTAASFSVGLGAKNAIAALNMNFSTERTSEAFQYVGDELDRDEETIVTDTFAKFDFEAFLPKLGTIAGADPVITEVPMNEWLQAAGLGIVLSTDTTGSATATNTVVSNEFLSVEIRRSTADLNSDKTYVLSDARGGLDFDGQIGSKGKLKYNFEGNIGEVVQKPKLLPEFAQQKVNTAGALKSTSITLSELVVYTDENEPALLEVSNVCFDKLVAPNLPGFEYDRYLTSCDDGWSKGAVPSDVTLTIIEDSADAVYNPDEHVEDKHVLVVRSGTAAGERIELYFSKLTLANVPNSEVAKYAGQDLAFRSVGNFSLKMS